jgi:rubrerythrin
MYHTKKKTRTVPKPDEGARTVYTGRPPFFRGKDLSGPNWVCGVCETIFVQDMENGTFANIVFRCPNCGAYGEPA